MAPASSVLRRVCRRCHRSCRASHPAACGLLLALTLTGCRAQQPWPLWEAYTQRFLDAQGRVIDRSAQDRTTSEGQAYAMFFALVDNDRGHFDKLLTWTEANLAGGDLGERLPAWRWGRAADGQWKVLDDNAAADADVWLAYTLLEAGRLWHDPRYDRLGRRIAARVASEEIVLVPGIGTTLMPGPHGFHPEPGRYVVNPSYLALSPLVYLARTFPQGPWSGIVESMPAFVGGPASHRLAMDWVSAGEQGVTPSNAPQEPTAGVHEPQPAGSYDAIRVYLWLGLAARGTPGRAELLDQVSGMAEAMRSAVIPPLEVDPGGKVLRAESPVGFSAALAPYLLAVGMKAEARTQQARIVAIRDPATGLSGRTAEYYDQNLVLFSTGFLDQRYAFEGDGKLRVKWK